MMALQTLTRNRLFYIIGLLALIYANIRVFSRNHNARRKENETYLKLSKPVTAWFRLQIRKFRERKTSRFRKCPNCKKILRLPNQKGKHTVKCPNCRHEFETRITI